MRKFVASRGRAAAAVLTGTALVSGVVLVTAGTAFATATPVISVTALSVTKGSTAGGTNVLVTGKGFLGMDTSETDSVKFGASNGTGVLVLSDTQLAVTAPAGTGTVDVVVHDDGAANSSPVVTGDKFTYLAPIT